MKNKSIFYNNILDGKVNFPVNTLIAGINTEAMEALVSAAIDRFNKSLGKNSQFLVSANSFAVLLQSALRNAVKESYISFSSLSDLEEFTKIDKAEESIIDLLSEIIENAEKFKDELDTNRIDFSSIFLKDTFIVISKRIAKELAFYSVNSLYSSYIKSIDKDEKSVTLEDINGIKINSLFNDMDKLDESKNIEMSNALKILVMVVHIFKGYRIKTYKELSILADSYLYFTATTQGFLNAMILAYEKQGTDLLKLEAEHSKSTVEKDKKIKELSDKINKETKKFIKMNDKQESILAKIGSVDTLIKSEFKKSNKVNNSEMIKLVGEIKYKTLEDSFKSQIDNLTSQLVNLKVENKNLNKENTNLKNEIDSLKDKEIVVTKVEVNNDVKEPVKVEPPKPLVDEKNKQFKLGIVSLEDNKCTAYVLSSGETFDIEIPNLANNWLTKGQVVVLKDNKFHAYTTYSIPSEMLKTYDKNCRLYKALNCNIGNRRFIRLMDASGKVLEIPAGRYSTLDNHYVLVKNNQIELILRKVRYNLDLYKDFFEMNDMETVCVIGKISNGYVVRSCISGEEHFVSSIVCEENTNISVGNLAIMKNNIAIKVLTDNRFYTLSESYKDKIINVTVKGDLGIKPNGETILLARNNMMHIEDGYVATIDEFGNVLKLSDMSKNETAPNFKKVKGASIKDTAKNPTTILIVGNPALKNSYSLTMFKENYRPVLVDGFASLNKVSQTIRKEDPDAIIIDTNHCSHENMWKIKELDVEYIISKESGASFMLSLLKDNEKVGGNNGFVKVR